TAYRMALLAALCLVSGCSYGMTADKFAPAKAPQGVVVHLVIGTAPLDGELLEVRDEAVVIVAGKALRLVPYAVVTHSSIDQTKVVISGGRAPSSEDRERLRLLSRFPQGLGSDVLERLLRAYGQTELA